ncbi:MAG: NAD(P)-dependent oxidoreductase [Thermoplasmata archaeon]|nr:NAD(P)-dependent oxidoreductase [Thermoplasmata archaeon]
MTRETVFVVGASGLVGSAAVRALALHGHEVRALVRRPEAVAGEFGPGVAVVAGDLIDAGAWGASLDGATAVVDATQVRVPGRLTVGIARAAAEDRRRMAMALLAQVRKRAPGLRRYIALSGLEDYAPTGDAWFDEKAPKAATLRGYSHLGVRARGLLAQARTEWGLPVVVLRMGLIYGSSGWFPGFVDRIRADRGVLVGSGSNFSSLVSAPDVGDAIRAAVERAEPGEEYLVTDDEPIRQREWQGVLASALGRPPVRRRVPVWVASLAVGRINAETFSSSRRARNGRAKERLGLTLRYPTVREGFPALVAKVAPPAIPSG